MFILIIARTYTLYNTHYTLHFTFRYQINNAFLVIRVAVQIEKRPAKKNIKKKLQLAYTMMTSNNKKSSLKSIKTQFKF